MKKFIPGETYIPISGKVFDNEEININQKEFFEALLRGYLVIPS